MEAAVDIWKTAMAHVGAAAIYAVLNNSSSAVNISVFAQILGVDNSLS